MTGLAAVPPCRIIASANGIAFIPMPLTAAPRPQLPGYAVAGHPFCQCYNARTAAPTPTNVPPPLVPAEAAGTAYPARRLARAGIPSGGLGESRKDGGLVQRIRHRLARAARRALGRRTAEESEGCPRLIPNGARRQGGVGGAGTGDAAGPMLLACSISEEELAPRPFGARTLRRSVGSWLGAVRQKEHPRPAGESQRTGQR